MALATAPSHNAALRGSVVPFRARKHDRRTELEDARLELRSLASEVKAYAVRIHSAAAADDLRVVGHLSGRLWALGNSYTGDNDHAA